MSLEPIDPIAQLDDSIDYSLWRIRILAAINADDEGNIRTTTDFESDPQLVHQCEISASNVIINSLSDDALRLVKRDIGSPKEMIRRLDIRYDSKTMTSKISMVCELLGMKYNDLKDNLWYHVDHMAWVIERLRRTGCDLCDLSAIVILLESIKAEDLQPLKVAIKTAPKKDIQWDEVATMLIEERRRLLSDRGIFHNPSVAGSSGTDHFRDRCAICGKKSHDTKDCFFNPLNPNNKLQLSAEVKRKLRI